MSLGSFNGGEDIVMKISVSNPNPVPVKISNLTLSLGNKSITVPVIPLAAKASGTFLQSIMTPPAGAQDVTYDLGIQYSWDGKTVKKVANTLVVKKRAFPKPTAPLLVSSGGDSPQKGVIYAVAYLWNTNAFTISLGATLYAGTKYQIKGAELLGAQAGRSYDVTFSGLAPGVYNVTITAKYASVVDGIVSPTVWSASYTVKTGVEVK